MWGTNIQGGDLKYSEFLEMFKQNKISSFDMNIANRTVDYIQEGSKVEQRYKVPDSELFINDFYKIKDDYNLSIDYDIEAGVQLKSI